MIRLWPQRKAGRSLRTKRLRLRPLTTKDAARIAVLAGDWDVARMTGRVPHPYSPELADQWIGGLIDGEFVRGIEHKRELIGVCGYLPDGNGSAEIGYWLGKQWWGQGFATEAAAALVSHCFEDRGFARLTCGHFVDNVASRKVIAKLGFYRIGPGRQWCEARRIELETTRYELLNEATARERAVV